MTSADAHYDRWYLKLLAVYWGTVGIGASCYYLSLRNNPTALLPRFSVFMTTVMTIGSITYFFKPRWGHHILLALSVIALLMKGSEASVSDAASAHMYWAIMTGILLLPMIRRRDAQKRDYLRIRT